MTIRFTHVYDLLYRGVVIFAAIVLTGITCDFVGALALPLEQYLKTVQLSWLWSGGVWAFAIGGYIGAWLLLERTLLPSWLPTYCHVRFELSTKITGDEAKLLGFLFDGSLGGVWYPLESLAKLAPEYRREALFRFGNKIAKEQWGRTLFPMPEDQVWRYESGHQAQGPASEKAANSRREPRTEDPRTEASLETLGLRHMPAAFAEVKAAYRRKIGEFHPDRFAGERPEVIEWAEDMAKKLNGAYAYLEKRFAGKAA